MRLLMTSSRWSSSSQTISARMSNEPAVITTYSTSDMAVGVRHWIEVALDIDADHRLPAEAHGERVRDGDDLHHALVEQLLDALASAASDRPTALPIAAYGRRPSCWSCSMMARDTESSWGLPFLDSRVESLGSALRLATSWLLHEVSTVPQGCSDEIRCLRGRSLRISQSRGD